MRQTSNTTTCRISRGASSAARSRRCFPGEHQPATPPLRRHRRRVRRPHRSRLRRRKRPRRHRDERMKRCTGDQPPRKARPWLPHRQPRRNPAPLRPVYRRRRQQPHRQPQPRHLRMEASDERSTGWRSHAGIGNSHALTAARAKTGVCVRKAPRHCREAICRRRGGVRLPRKCLRHWRSPKCAAICAARYG